MQNEESLVEQAKEGNHQAFAQLYEAYFERIYRYLVLRIGDKAEAEDMTQQVFLHALQSISSFKWRGIPFLAWLFRIAHNQMTDFLRKKKQVAIPVEEWLISPDPNPQLLTERQLNMEQLMLAIKQLTEAQGEVISLRFTSGLSTAEVAKIMGKSQGAVKALQHSAIVALRKRLAVGKDEEI